jgi:AcrR family transcriptional regulator
MKYWQTMASNVKRRAYDASARQSQSAATRQRIIDAARALILQHGYRATTIATIAAEAGVNADSVYALVGRKPMLLRELIEQALSGTDHEVVAEDRAYVRAVRAEVDPAKKLAIYARAVCVLQQRMAPLFLALRDASSTETEAQQVWQEISDRRAANMRKLARELRSSGGLRPGLSIDQAADIVWAMNGSELFVLLTIERGWSLKRYERWLADSWCRLLLR